MRFRAVFTHVGLPFYVMTLLFSASSHALICKGTEGIEVSRTFAQNYLSWTYLTDHDEQDCLAFGNLQADQIIERLRGIAKVSEERVCLKLADTSFKFISNSTSFKEMWAEIQRIECGRKVMFQLFDKGTPEVAVAFENELQRSDMNFLVGYFGSRGNLDGIRKMKALLAKDNDNLKKLMAGYILHLIFHFTAENPAPQAKLDAIKDLLKGTNLDPRKLVLASIGPRNRESMPRTSRPLEMVLKAIHSQGWSIDAPYQCEGFDGTLIPQRGSCGAKKESCASMRMIALLEYAKQPAAMKAFAAVEMKGELAHQTLPMILKTGNVELISAYKNANPKPLNSCDAYVSASLYDDLKKYPHAVPKEKFAQIPRNERDPDNLELRKAVYEYAAWHLRFSGMADFGSYLRTLDLNIEELLNEKICDHIETTPESVASLVLIAKLSNKSGLPYEKCLRSYFSRNRMDKEKFKNVLSLAILLRRLGYRQAASVLQNLAQGTSDEQSRTLRFVATASGRAFKNWLRGKEPWGNSPAGAIRQTSENLARVTVKGHNAMIDLNSLSESQESVLESYRSMPSEDTLAQAAASLHIEARPGTGFDFWKLNRFLKGIPHPTSQSGVKTNLEYALGPEIKYNSEATSVVDILEKQRLQCSSGTLLFALTRTKRGPWDSKVEEVVIYTHGHVLPGAIFRDATSQKWRLEGYEMTAAGNAVVDFGLTDQMDVSMMVVPQHIYFFAEVFGDQIKNVDSFVESVVKKMRTDFGFNETLGRELSRRPLQRPKQLNESIFAFGSPSTPPGDQDRAKGETIDINSYKGRTPVPGQRHEQSIEMRGEPSMLFTTKINSKLIWEQSSYLRERLDTTLKVSQYQNWKSLPFDKQGQLLAELTSPFEKLEIASKSSETSSCVIDFLTLSQAPLKMAGLSHIRGDLYEVKNTKGKRLKLWVYSYVAKSYHSEHFNGGTTSVLNVAVCKTGPGFPENASPLEAANDG